MIATIFDSQPATNRQKNYLRHLGVAFDDSISKHEASTKIDIAVWEMEEKHGL